MPQDMLDHLKTLVVSISSNELMVSCNQTSVSNSRICNQSEKNEASIKSRTFQRAKIIPTTNKRKIAKQKWKSEHQSQINASERDRKGRLAACIKKLKEELPHEDIKLQTKESILEESVKYIRLLKAKVEDMLLKDSSENLCAELTTLRKKVQEYEAEKKIYHRILQSHGLLSGDQIKKAKLPIPCFSIKRGEKSSKEKSMKVSNLPVSNCSKHESTPAARTNCDISSPHHELQPAINNTTESGEEDSVFGQHRNKSSALRLISSGMLLPCCDTFHHRSSCAPCTLTYSMARINADRPKNPILPCLSTIVLPGITSALPRTNSVTTRQSSAAYQPDCSRPSSPTCSHAVSSSKAVLKPSSHFDSIDCTATQKASKSSNNEYQNLLSWLRTSNSSADKPRTVATVSTAFTRAGALLETDKGKTQSLQEELSPTSTSKKDTNSFNIASLMKSSASLHHSPANAHFQDRDRTPLREPISESCDYKSVTPNLHQSFDNDIFECLQNIRGLTTPEPPGRSVEDTNVATTSSLTALHTPSYNAATFFESNRSGSDVRKERALSQYEYDTIQTDPRQVVIADSGNSGEVSGAHCFHQSGPLPGSVDVPSKHHSLRVEKQLFPHPAYGGSQTPNTQLWQPAITHARPQHRSFSPISHTYLSNSTPQLTHTSTNNAFWMSLTTSYQPYRLPRTDTGVTATKPEISKKRKLQRSNKSVVKRRKSNPRAGLAQEDAHSISRLIGSSHYPAVTSWPPSHSCLPSQRRAAPSCGDERSTTEQVPIFQTGCTSVMHSPCMGGSNYAPQSNLFHSSNVINPQTPSYHPPPSGYFPYNPAVTPHSQPTRGTLYVPRFGNTNNNNIAHAYKQQKGSQHHIRQILS